MKLNIAGKSVTIVATKSDFFLFRNSFESKNAGNKISVLSIALIIWIAKFTMVMSWNMNAGDISTG